MRSRFVLWEGEREEGGEEEEEERRKRGGREEEGRVGGREQTENEEVEG